MTLRARKTLLIAFAVWFGFVVLALLIGPFSARSIEAQLETSARDALDQRGFSWVQVRMDGQRAIVSGAAPSAEQREDALAIVRASSWSGGRVAGGVTRVIDETTNARLDQGFAFRADMSSRGRVLIRGDATDAAARDAVARFARTVFPSGAETDLTLVPGGASSAEWEEAAKRLLGQLARLESGAFVLDGDQAGFVGEAGNPQVAASIAGILEGLPAPYSAAHVIVPAGGSSVIAIGDETGCAAVLAAAQGAETLRFDREAETMSPLTNVAVRRVGRTFAACPDTSRLVIEVGIAQGGEALAASRADAVISALAAVGLDADQADIRLLEDASHMLYFKIETNEG